MMSIAIVSELYYGEVRNNDWDDANPATWDAPTSTPQYQVCCNLYMAIT
jgi:hypothetical protein